MSFPEDAPRQAVRLLNGAGGQFLIRIKDLVAGPMDKVLVHLVTT